MKINEGHETVNFGGREVKGQGQTKPNIDLEASGGIIFDRLVK